jgi:hypothetical protein
MATQKRAHLDGTLVRKGEAKAASPTTPAATKNTIAVTVRLDPELYLRLKKYGVSFRPRKTNQKIIVEVLKGYLDAVEAEG